MNVTKQLQRWRDWFPVPDADGVKLGRWILLDGHRFAVSAALLTLVFVSLVVMGSVWTFELQRILTETQAIQTILNTLLSGIILLVSIVVSINSIVLSHDITSVSTQEDRIEGVMEYRRELGRLTDEGESPSDPASFLTLMGEVLSDRAQALTQAAEGIDEEIAREIEHYGDAIAETADQLGKSSTGVTGADFGVLWRGLEVSYGTYLDRSRMLKSAYGERLPDPFEDRLNALIEAFELFATGKEYFKTLYYTRETSQLSRTLLVISLPAILLNGASILAINAGLLPQVGLLGLPPLLSFVAATFTVSLAPYVVLTAYMLRLATVARRTAAAGPFTLGNR